VSAAVEITAESTNKVGATTAFASSSSFFPLEVEEKGGGEEEEEGDEDKDEDKDEDEDEEDAVAEKKDEGEAGRTGLMNRMVSGLGPPLMSCTASPQGSSAPRRER
jgi:hypothetical protein